MFGLDMLDVAIGVVFLYLVMSLIASAAIEFIEVLLQYRGRDLLRGIAELIDNDTILANVYKHPLIASLYRDDFKDVTKAGWLSKRKLPSYIPARNFALALFDELGVPLDGATAAAPPPAGAVAPLPAAAAPIALPVGFATTGVHQAIGNLVKAAANNATKARENVEEWFNASMDRVSGWYKRRTHWILAGVGLLAAAAMNVDSIAVATKLAADKPLRDAIVKTATDYAKTEKPPQSATPVTSTSTYDEKNAALAAASKRLTGEVQRLDSLGLPIGWKDYPWPSDPFEQFTRILGILITAFAVTLGAPFWFDVLNKIIVVRSTVKPKEKSGIEGSKEPR